jgi:5-methyltetrahydrofolate--homocysteine methyltransferase
MRDGAGFEVRDLGTDVEPEQFLKAVKEIEPDVAGMSALPITTVCVMADTITALEEAGVRDLMKVMIGGAPVTQRFAGEIDADRYAANAASASDLAMRFLGAG